VKKRDKERLKNAQARAARKAKDNEKPIFSLVVPCFKDGHVEVGGWPEDMAMEQVMQILAAGMIRTAQHFRKLGDDENLSRILTLNKQQLAQAKIKLGHS